MTDTGKRLAEYITHLRKAREDVEKRQDEQMGPYTNPHTPGVQALESEFITLGVVIRDLQKIVNVQEFSYWDI